MWLNFMKELNLFFLIVGYAGEQLLLVLIRTLKFLIKSNAWRLLRNLSNEAKN